MRTDLRPPAPCAALLPFLALLVAGPAVAGDADGDGVRDALDNCLMWPNPSQVDVNLDGYGNHCDADVDDDGDVDGDDLAACLGAVGFSVCDLNYDGLFNTTDLALIATFTGGPPGPSGLSCAGSIPCSAPLVPAAGAAGGLLLGLLLGTLGIALQRRRRRA